MLREKSFFLVLCSLYLSRYSEVCKNLKNNILFFCLKGILKGECRPFFVDGKQVGLIRPDVVNKLLSYPEVFMMRESDLDGRVSYCNKPMMAYGIK